VLASYVVDSAGSAHFLGDDYLFHFLLFLPGFATGGDDLS
jgi:hypothetical protein